MPSTTNNSLPVRSFRLLAILSLLILAALACNFPSVYEEPFVFPTPITYTPGPGTVLAAEGTQTPQATPTPTYTPRVWPPPYYGSPGPTQITPVPQAAPVIDKGNSINVLLIGSDRFTNSFRTDTLILVNYQPDYKLATMLSIPRDLYLYIPGWRMQRINTAWQHGVSENYPEGGSGLLKDTLLYNLGIQVDHIARVDFAGFSKIVNTLGGVDVPVYCAYTDWHVINPNGDLDDEDNWSLYTVGPGVVHMDGDLALWYARSRIKSSDFDRGRRQQEVLRALFSRGLSLGMIPRIPQLWGDINNSIETDLSLDEIVSLAPFALDMTSAKIRSYYINTDVVNGWWAPNGAAYLVPKPNNEMLALVAEAMGPPLEKETNKLSATVEVWNGTGNPSWDELAIERLNYAGFESYPSTGDGNRYNNTQLHVIDPLADANQTASLLTALGLNQSQLVTNSSFSSMADYILIVGSDYQVCFNPSKIDR
jgi:LCP family protein required for cell wall assembly